MPEQLQMDERTRTAVAAALDKKAEDLMVLDVGEICGFASTLVICHGHSTRQVKTISDAVADAMREQGWRPHHVEGEREGEWILMDFMDLVVHIFVGEKRRFYALERLWGDAPRLEPVAAEAASSPRPARSGKRAES